MPYTTLELTAGSLKNLFAIVSNSIRLLDRDALLIPVPMRLFNTEPENTRVYQALFTDTDILPWEESPPQG